MKARKPVRVCPEFTAVLHQIAAGSEPVRRLLELGWKIYGVRQYRGHCRASRKQITVPHWAQSRGPDYVVYYLHHEAAHAYSSGMHSPEFYEQFKRICPPHVQHFELNYKPRTAKAAGITAKDAK